MPDNIQIFGQLEGEPIETDERAPVTVTADGAILTKLDPASDNQVLIAAENNLGIATPLQIDSNGRLKVEAGFTGNITVDNIEFGTALTPADNMTGIQGPVVVAALISNHDGHWDTVKSDKNHGIHVKVSNGLTIDNFPASQEVYGTVAISGSVTVNDGGGPLTVDGTVGASQVGEWDINSVSSIANPVAIIDNDGSITVDGSVNIGNFPAVQTVDGTVNIGNASVVVADGGGSLTVDGSVSVSNFPATQAVSGTVTVGNASVTVDDGGSSITVDGTVGVSGSVTVADGGGSLTVDGTVSVGNFPASYPITDNGGSITVDGSVTVSNSSIAVTDNGGSLTVDGTVTPSNVVADGAASTASDRITPIGGIDSSGNWQAIKVDSNGLLELSGTLTVGDGSGPLTVDGTVSVGNFPATQAVSGSVAITNASIPVTDNGGSLTVDGSVSVANFPATQAVSGTVAISSGSVTISDGGGSVTVDGSVGVTGTVTVQDGGGSLTVDGSVSVSNFPAVQPISDNNGSITVDGTVAISNTNITVVDGGGSITVDGTVNAVQSGTWTTDVTFPSSMNVSDGGGSLTVDGTVNIGNLPATQPISGTITIGNTPLPISDNGASITVDGTVAVSSVSGTVAVTDNSGSLTVDDGGGSLTIDGTVTALQSGTWAISSVGSITNTVSIQDGGNSITVDGTVGVSNFPASYPVTDNGGSLTIDGTVSLSNVVADGAASAAGDRITPIGGLDSSNNWQAIAVDTTGKVILSGTQTVSGTVSVSNFPATQPVSGTVAISNTSIPVTDNGGSLTVDGTVAATQSGTWSVRNQDGSGNALTSAARGAERALSVQIVDGSGNQISTFGGGVVYVEDVASAGGESLTLAGAIRQDTPATSTSADGDYTNLKTDSAGRLWVNASGSPVPINDNGGSITVDGTVAATQSGTWSVRNQDGSGNNLTSVARGSERALSVQVVDGSGTQITTFGGPQYIEDTASVGGESLTMAGTIRQDTPASTTSADGDYSSLKTDSLGRLWVNASGAPIPITDNSGSITVDGSVSVSNFPATQPVSGTVAISNASIPVTDNGGSLTVDGTVAATQSGTWSSRTQDGSGNAITSAARGAERALSVQLVDASGNQITTFGGGVVYTEDTASGGAESLTLMGAVRSDSPSTSTSADGDYANLKTDSVGRLWVNAVVTTAPFSTLTESSVSFTRPANTTAYAIGDAVTNSATAPTILSFTSVGTAGYITGVRFSKSSTGSTNPRFRLYLFDTTRASVNDNTAITFTQNDIDTMISFIDLYPAFAASSAFAFEHGFRIPYKLPSGTTIFGLLSVTGAYTPASAEEFRMSIIVEQQ